MKKIIPKQEVFIIGEIYFGEETIMEAYGPIYLEAIGNCKIYVYGNEGTIPHFHLISENGKFETCICIKEAKYFKHGKKNGTLTKKQKEELNHFLEQINKKVPDRTNWEATRDAWNFSNDTNIISMKIKKPDYRLMVQNIK